MNIIAFLIVGLLAGLIAGKLMEGHGFGTLGDLVIGIIGAFVGGFVFDAFGYQATGFWSTLLTSVVGAVLFLAVAHMFHRAAGPTKTPQGRILERK